MRRTIVRLTFLAVLAIITGGCSMGRQIGNFSVDYNRAVAHSRDEVLFLNIIRARYREPLQFSTIASVQGSLEMTGSLENDADKLLEWRTGGQKKDIASLSPKLTLSTSSKPTFTIQPLSDKDFMAEMLTPITPEKVDLLLKQNWDPEFILPLVIGSVTCKNQVFANTYHKGRSALAVKLAKSQWRASLSSDDIPAKDDEGREIQDKIIVVDADKAPRMLHEGVGDDSSIEIKSTNNENRSVTLLIKRNKKTVWSITGLPTINCDELADEKANIDANFVQASAPSSKKFNLDSTSSLGNVSKKNDISVQFRSVEGIIYYLGEALRNPDVGRITYNSDCISTGAPLTCPKVKTLFEAHTGTPNQPIAVQTTLEGTHYWIPVAQDPDGLDRTLSTLSILSELIALQTSDDTKAVPQPVINVAPGR